MSLSFTSITTDDDQAELGRILTECFAFPPANWDTYVSLIERDAFRCLRRDGRMVAGCGVYKNGQYFGGRVVGSGGVAAVGVPPEERGTGVAFELMSELVRDQRAQGVPLLSLYASTQRLYRKVGFEQAGYLRVYRMPLADVGSIRPPLTIERVTAPGHEMLRDVYSRWAVSQAGVLDRAPGSWTRVSTNWAGGPERLRFLVVGAKGPEGYVIFRLEEGKDDEGEIAVSDLVALTPAALQSIWALLAGHRSNIKWVRWPGPPMDPSQAIFPEQRARVHHQERWMLRIADLPAALTKRGYAPFAKGELHLEVTDELVTENSGLWRLEVNGGEGGATRTAADGGAKSNVSSTTIRTSIRAMASLYSGFLSATELRRIGWIDAGDEAVAIADQLFHGPAPWMPEGF